MLECSIRIHHRVTITNGWRVILGKLKIEPRQPAGSSLGWVGGASRLHWNVPPRSF